MACINYDYDSYDEIVQESIEIFNNKTRDYGTSWRILRLESVIDQILIKAMRIRNLQNLVTQKVSDDIPSEYKGIFNYAIIGLMQLWYNKSKIEDLSVHNPYTMDVETLYSDCAKVCKKIMHDKNHDYGEAWRDMSKYSFPDIILMKLLRSRQILANDGNALYSEGIDANFIDIANYAVFALIMIKEGKI